jgi:hypothetical protein
MDTGYGVGLLFDDTTGDLHIGNIMTHDCRLRHFGFFVILHCDTSCWEMSCRLVSFTSHLYKKFFGYDLTWELISTLSSMRRYNTFFHVMVV